VGVKPPRIALRIDELVLDGFSPLDGRRIAEAVGTELTRLLAERGLPPSLARLGAVDFIDAGEIRISPGGSANRIGIGLAAGLYSGLKR